ncbi:LuxR C-terminal-related transcriptional regulator [Embleya sp. NPDC056575]|uniref:helix-turn-helix transcriptional regulator n=1 Tax=unclassified Embleya TaxID=2699296 RepID=UPI0036988882
MHGRIALERGRVRQAASLFAEARAQAHVQRHGFAEHRALAGLVPAHAYAGHVGPEAAQLADTVAADPALCGWDTLRAHAWAQRCRGHADEAHALLRDAAGTARLRGDSTGARVLEHDLVRWGDRAAARRLAAMTDEAQGAHAAARTAHAHAVADADPAALDAASDAWAALGATLLAAECLAEAARLRRSARGPNREAAARRAHARALLLTTRCEGAATPGLVSLSAAGALSAREHQIALMAADGHTSREIARHCGLSIRTVDDTPGRAYRKTGVRDRHGLRSILATTLDERAAGWAASGFGRARYRVPSTSARS